MTLVVTQATANVSNSSPARGSMDTVSGASWAPSDQLQITFVDNTGTQTTYPTVSANGAGAFSTSITIPAGASTGAATITTRSLSTGADRGLVLSITP